MRRGRGRSKCGTKAVAIRKHTGSKRNTCGSHYTLIGAMSPTEGIIHWELRLGSTTGKVYTEFISNLLKTEFMKTKSRIIIHDNAKIHQPELIDDTLLAAD